MTMRIIVLLLSLALSAGCVNRKYSTEGAPKQVGNLAAVESAVLVRDVAETLNLLYAPAKTGLILRQEMTDPFSVALVERLRLDGYAIVEYTPPDRIGQVSEVLAGVGEGLGFAYVVDRIDRDLRLTLYIGTDVLSRAYVIKGSDAAPTYAPAGNWSRKREG